MKTSNVIQIQEILLKAMLHCSPAEFMTFTAWLTDALKYNPSASVLAARTKSTRQNANRNLISLVKKEVLTKLKKEKVPGSKNWKNTYTLGPVFGLEINVSQPQKEPLTDFIPKESIATFFKVKEKIQELDDTIKKYNLKVNRKDGERFQAMQGKVLELESRINLKNYKNIDYKIQDLVDAAESHRAWIKNRTDDLYYHNVVIIRIELPTFDDLILPKLKDVKNEKS